MSQPNTTLADARTALACLDLTSLNDADQAADIDALCLLAVGADPARGAVPAVCVWPRFVAQARARLPAGIAVAAVANFPDGSSDTARSLRDSVEIVQAGGQEVDVVISYRDLDAAPALLASVRRACAGLRLKVILVSGVLQDPALITRACRIALDAGADFLKTSTGKTATSATPEAARLMLQAIASHPRGAQVGFKASGGIRTVADAGVYIALVRELLGESALTAARFRIGASGLLNDIEAVLAGGSRPAATTAY